MSAQDPEELRRIEDEERQARQRMQAAFAGKSDDDLMKDVAQLVEAVRLEERDRTITIVRPQRDAGTAAP